jgi:hypothetical protein
MDVRAVGEVRRGDRHGSGLENDGKKSFVVSHPALAASNRTRRLEGPQP